MKSKSALAGLPLVLVLLSSACTATGERALFYTDVRLLQVWHLKGNEVTRFTSYSCDGTNVVVQELPVPHSVSGTR